MGGGFGGYGIELDSDKNILKKNLNGDQEDGMKDANAANPDKELLQSHEVLSLMMLMQVDSKNGSSRRRSYGRDWFTKELNKYFRKQSFYF